MFRLGNFRAVGVPADPCRHLRSFKEALLGRKRPATKLVRFLIHSEQNFPRTLGEISGLPNKLSLGASPVRHSEEEPYLNQS